MLNSPEFEVIKKEVNSHYYRFTIQAIEIPFMCTHCWEELDLPIEDDIRLISSNFYKDNSDLIDKGVLSKQQSFLLKKGMVI